nr:hypothetical protein [Streptomyces cacaoi]
MLASPTAKPSTNRQTMSVAAFGARPQPIEPSTKIAPARTSRCRRSQRRAASEPPTMAGSAPSSSRLVTSPCPVEFRPNSSVSGSSAPEIAPES